MGFLHVRRDNKASIIAKSWQYNWISFGYFSGYLTEPFLYHLWKKLNDLTLCWLKNVGIFVRVVKTFLNLEQE